jgi:hypothetical protein
MTEASDEAWPELSYARLAPTAEVLQLWSQIVGKVRLARTPWLNHSWHVSLRVSARGLATPLIPGEGVSFSLEFDFVDHVLAVRVTDGRERRIRLGAGSVADFHAAVMDALASLGLATRIDARPNELARAVPFADDVAPRAYDPEQAARLWRAMVQIERVFTRFRSGFLGKASPVHLFWGSFDLAVTRFSGRRAPPHPGGIPNLPDAVTREAYSHEVSSAGFWPGGRLRGSPRRSWRRRRRASTPASASSCCPTATSAPRRIRTPRCWPSCAPPTPRPPISAAGTARRSNATKGLPARHARFDGAQPKSWLRR